MTDKSTPDRIAREIVEKWLPMSSAMLAERMLRGAIAAALTAELEARKKAEAERDAARAEAKENEKWGQDGWEFATYEIGGVPHFWKDRAEKAEAERDEAREAIRGLLHEWDKLTRYGSPIAKAANEHVAFARAILALIDKEPVSHD